MNLNLVNEITKSQLRSDLPSLRVGQTLKLDITISEGEKTRTQSYEGLLIKIQGSGIGKTITVRKISNGIGVERTFPVHSPVISKISVIKNGKVRRAKLYYLRSLTGKAARIKEVR